jgi:hypothetical protein
MKVIVKPVYIPEQCCGSITFWCGSVSADPGLCLINPDPAIFVIDLQDANKKNNKKVFLLFTFLRFIYILFVR